FTYVCADNYLKKNGKLGFLITMEVFKSKGAGEGFRGFELKDKGVPLKVLLMEDMVDLKPFRAANKTSLFVLQKGKRTTYPVPVVQWHRKKGIGHIPPDWEYPKVRRNSTREEVSAVPVDPDKAVSSWQTAAAGHLRMQSHLKGENPYRPWVGARIEPYGVFWLKLQEVRPDRLLVVANMHSRGKTKVKPVKAAIEPAFVYPTLSGGDLVRYGHGEHFYALVTQDPLTREGVEMSRLESEAPLTLAYLEEFRDLLLKRAAFRKYYCEKQVQRGRPATYIPNAPFYSQYNIGPWTFANWRVVWKRMASRMEAVVLHTVKTEFGTKPVISTDTTSLIALDNKAEAHYLCAVLNSDIINDFIKSFSSAGRGFGAPSIMSNIAIPKFSAGNKLHQELARLSEEAHGLVKSGKPVDEPQDRINAAALRLWNIKS
ncbi:hypothetical protein JXD38_05770, partial [candidate division WOR-3 bacterium]|nr:hypothetical protein [candidate division WOR-3 bacterium]